MPKSDLRPPDKIGKIANLTVFRKEERVFPPHPRAGTPSAQVSTVVWIVSFWSKCSLAITTVRKNRAITVDADYEIVATFPLPKPAR